MNGAKKLQESILHWFWIITGDNNGAGDDDGHMVQSSEGRKWRWGMRAVWIIHTSTVSFICQINQ